MIRGDESGADLRSHRLPYPLVLFCNVRYPFQIFLILHLLYGRGSAATLTNDVVSKILVFNSKTELKSQDVGLIYCSSKDAIVQWPRSVRRGRPRKGWFYSFYLSSSGYRKNPRVGTRSAVSALKLGIQIQYGSGWTQGAVYDNS